MCKTLSLGLRQSSVSWVLDIAGVTENSRVEGQAETHSRTDLHATRAAAERISEAGVLIDFHHQRNVHMEFIDDNL